MEVVLILASIVGFGVIMASTLAIIIGLFLGE